MNEEREGRAGTGAKSEIRKFIEIIRKALPLFSYIHF